MKKIALIILTISFCGLTACKTGTKKGGNMDNETLVKIETTLGDIKVKLYNETPKHRDNFIKLAEDGVYEGTLFTVLSKTFMIQAGDPDSKNAPKGKCWYRRCRLHPSGRICLSEVFSYKRRFVRCPSGRQCKPKKESSGCQFYIVTGKVYNDSTLLGMESQMNENKINVIFNTLAQKHMKEIYKMRKENDENGFMNCRRSFCRGGSRKCQTTGISLLRRNRSKLIRLGGPHLDGEYTVSVK